MLIWIDNSRLLAVIKIVKSGSSFRILSLVVKVALIFQPSGRRVLIKRLPIKTYRSKSLKTNTLKFQNLVITNWLGQWSFALVRQLFILGRKTLNKLDASASTVGVILVVFTAISNNLSLCKCVDAGSALWL